MLVDSHCHLNMPELVQDLDKIVFNAKKNILGMMPHPERMVDEMISNTDGVNLFSSLLNK